MAGIDALADRLSTYLGHDQVNLVRRAYFYAEQAHDGQRRRSGEAYVTHPLAVASILADMHMDHQSLMAAMLHDVIVTLGIWAVFQLKFDLSIVAALLTILGYSVNDTVVIFDRLRENLAKYKTMPLREMMNLTANETLSRTVMTATTTLISLIVLIVWGGDVIRGFVFAMILGVILGTYSTLYMAKNIVLFLGVDRGDKPKKSASEFADVEA